MSKKDNRTDRDSKGTKRLELSDLSELTERIQKIEHMLDDTSDEIKRLNYNVNYALHDINLANNRIDSMIKQNEKTEASGLNTVNINFTVSIDDPQFYNFLEDLHEIKAKYGYS